MILDDGGDATLLIHKGVEYERAGAVPDPSTAESRGAPRHPRDADPLAGVRQPAVDADAPPGSRASPRRPPPASTASTSWPRRGELLFARDQRQRLGHQVEVRQPLRLPPLAGRRDQPRHRRDDRRQGRGDLRLRRRRQGLRGVAARPGRSGDRHRDRSDLRPPGLDAGLRGAHARRGRRDRRHLRHRDRQQGHHHRRRTWRG